MRSRARISTQRFPSIPTTSSSSSSSSSSSASASASSASSSSIIHRRSSQSNSQGHHHHPTTRLLSTSTRSEFHHHQTIHPKNHSRTPFSLFDWLSFSSIKNSSLGSTSSDPDILNNYPQLKSQSISYPFLKPSLDHPTLSRIIHSHHLSHPNQIISIYHDLRSVWNYTPSDQDTLAYLSASLIQATPLPSHPIPLHLRIQLLERSQNYQHALRIAQLDPHHRSSEPQLAHLIRLSIKDHLVDQLTLWSNHLPIQNFQDQTLIHGALLLTSDQQPLRFILDALLIKNQKLAHWIQLDLVQRLLTQDAHQIDTLFQVLTKLSSSPYHPQPTTLDLIQRIILHLPPSYLQNPDRLISFTDRLYQTTGIDIFRIQTPNLAQSLFHRILPSPSFDRLWDWYQLFKSRSARVIEGCMMTILEFPQELVPRQDRVDELITDFQSLAQSRSSSTDHLISCLLNLINLTIESNRPNSTETLLELDPKRLERSPIKTELLIELIDQLLFMALDRDQAYRFHQRLIGLGQPDSEYFERFLKSFLRLCESPPRSMNEKPQALSMKRLMEILESMKSFGVSPTAQTYSILLNHFSSIVKMNPRNLSTRLQLERIHTLIKLDVNLEPDFKLLHQLFKAFSYNGLYSKAWSIWDRFFLININDPSSFEPPEPVDGHRHDPHPKISVASFATMFDLAGFESERFGDGRLNLRAIEGWNFLVQQTLSSSNLVDDPRSRIGSNYTSKRWSNCRLNKNLFDSWIECLCRARRIDEALELIFPSPSKEVTDHHSQSTHHFIQQDDHEPQGLRARVQMDLLRPILLDFIDQRTLSILIRFCKREDEILKNPNNCYPLDWHHHDRRDRDDDPIGRHRTLASPSSTYSTRVEELIKSRFHHLWHAVQDQGKFN